MNGVVSHDLTYLPPRCCAKEVPRAIIVNSLTEQEFEDFTNAEIEKQTQVKTYCSNSECGRFIAPCYIAAGEATCPRCKTRTCTMCNSPQHEGDCPADTGLEAILDLGAENQWRRCFSCRSMVSIERGCNHMTPDNAAVPSGSRKTSSGVPSKSSVEPHLWIFSLQSVSVALPQFKTNFATLTSVSIAAAKSSHRSTMEGAKDSGARCVMRDIGGSSCDAVAVSWRFVGIVVCIVSESGKT
ncbi:hypothetical protein CFE70_000878 [Pyrenophora teres f. teres 0-1]